MNKSPRICHATCNMLASGACHVLQSWLSGCGSVIVSKVPMTLNDLKWSK